MTPVNPSNDLDRTYQFQLRVRYHETDAQGHVHHAVYITYFELARCESFRASGVSYREFEESGLNFVIASVACDYLQPSHYDDLLTIKITIAQARRVRIRHEYEIFREEELVAKGHSVVVCVDGDGKVKRLPDWLRLD